MQFALWNNANADHAVGIASPLDASTGQKDYRRRFSLDATGAAIFPDSSAEQALPAEAPRQTRPRTIDTVERPFQAINDNAAVENWRKAINRPIKHIDRIVHTPLRDSLPDLRALPPRVVKNECARRPL